MHSTCRIGTTLCHPKIGYVDLTRNPALDTLALNSPLGHLNGDNAYSPQIPDTQNYSVTSKVQFLQLQQCLSSKSNEYNPSHVWRRTLPSQPSQLLITQFRLNKHNLSTSLAAPKANPIFHAANVTANWLKSHNGTLFSHVWRRGRLALDPLQK